MEIIFTRLTINFILPRNCILTIGVYNMYICYYSKLHLPFFFIEHNIRSIRLVYVIHIISLCVWPFWFLSIRLCPRSGVWRCIRWSSDRRLDRCWQHGTWWKTTRPFGDWNPESGICTMCLVVMSAWDCLKGPS